MTVPATSEKRTEKSSLWNLPNALTMMRIVLSVVLFVILSLLTPNLPHIALGESAILVGIIPGPYHNFLCDIALGVFIVAAVSDFFDGYYARKWNISTDFGRIADPFADKIIILGSMILLVRLDVYIAGWMVVLVLARELLVSGLRSYVEARGVEFGSMWSGKVKMFAQSFMVGFAIAYVGRFHGDAWVKWCLIALIGTTLITTFYSGAQYVFRTVKLLKQQEPAA